MAVNRTREITPNAQVRFPSQFDSLYGNRRDAYTGGTPRPDSITYPQYTPAQQYHNEKMAAERKYILATMAGRPIFERQTFREQRPGYVKTNPINNGAQPFFQNSGIMMPLPCYPGQLGSIHRHHAIQHKHLSGGVMTTMAGQQHARSILDRRAKQITQMENPDVPAEPEILTGEEAQKIELSGLLQQIFDGVITGNFTDILYQELRRCVVLLLRTIPLIDDADALNEIRIGFQDAFNEADGAASATEHHSSLARPQRVLDVKAGYIARLLGMLYEYMNGIVSGNSADLSMRDRITLSRSVAKSVGLGSLTKGIASSGLLRRDAPAEEEEEEEEGGLSSSLPPPRPGDEGGDEGGDEEGGDEGERWPWPPSSSSSSSSSSASEAPRRTLASRNRGATSSEPSERIIADELEDVGEEDDVEARIEAERQDQLRRIQERQFGAEAPASNSASSSSAGVSESKEGSELPAFRTQPQRVLIRRSPENIVEGRIHNLRFKPSVDSLPEDTQENIRGTVNQRREIALNEKGEAGRLNRLAFQIGKKAYTEAFNKQKGYASPELVKILRDLKVRGLPKDDGAITRTKAKNRLEIAYPQLASYWVEDY